MKRGRPRHYDWKQLFARPDGADSYEVTFQRGIDFVCEPHGFAQQVRQQASMREVSVTVKRENDSVTVMVLS
jgi:hypothetical protein